MCVLHGDDSLGLCEKVAWGELKELAGMNLKVSGVESAPFTSALSELHKAEQLLPALRILASSSI